MANRPSKTAISKRPKNYSGMDFLVQPGCMKEKVVVRMGKAVCYGCGETDLRPIPGDSSARRVFVLAGWWKQRLGGTGVKLKPRWYCPECVNWRTRPLDETAAFVLKRWMEDGDWHPIQWARERGITRLAVMWARNRLAKRGYVDPHNRRKLTVKAVVVQPAVRLCSHGVDENACQMHPEPQALMGAASAD